MPRTTVQCPECGGWAYIAFDGYFGCDSCRAGVHVHEFLRILAHLKTEYQRNIENLDRLRDIAEATQRPILVASQDPTVKTPDFIG